MDILRSFFRALLLPFSAQFWRDLFEGLRDICRAIHTIFKRILRGDWPPRRPEKTGCCIHLPADVYKRADPLIYSQYYLMSQGLAITWDNPDIDILDGAVPVTGPLQPDHRYRVRVRIWNGSYDAPAVGVGVELSYLSFGAQTESHPIGTGAVNLGAKGAVNCPAFLELDWRTPATGGHYCVQARLHWFDDANPDNNLGQKNITVAMATSPARFTFNVRNDAAVPRTFALEADAYRLPVPPDCGPQRDRPRTRIEESRALWAQAKRTQSYGQFPVPAAWTITIAPQRFGLEPRQEQTVEVAIEPNDPAFRGTRTFNVHVFTADERETRSLAGGVTLSATKA